MKHWRTTVIGIGLGAWEILSMVPDISSLTWCEIGIRCMKAAAVSALGVLAKDFDSGERPNAQ